MKYINEFIGIGGIRARMVADSISEGGIRITTIETHAPKFIDGEFEKHRKLSSCSSSTRAIPFGALHEVYIPEDVRHNERGMQGYYKIPAAMLGEFQADVKGIYEDTLEALIKYKGKVHKQHLGRYLEAFTFQDKAVTGTDWENFFNLRLADDVQPEMHELARLIKLAFRNSSPTFLSPGEWHLPYAIGSSFSSLEERKKSSSAGCARTSYGRAGGKEGRDLALDLVLSTDLLGKRHMTPFEHQATPMVLDYSATGNPLLWEAGVTHMDRKNRLWSGNFRGWIQNRQLLEEWSEL